MRGPGTFKARRLRPVLGVFAAVAVVLVTADVGAAAPRPAPATDRTTDPDTVRRELARHDLSLHSRPSPAVERCTLQPSGHSGVGEWRSCLRVSATMSAAPAVGQRATLRFEVQAQAARANTEISVELPESLRFAQPPAGARVTSSGSQAVIHRTFRADARWSSEATVVAVAAGPAQIRVQALAARPHSDAGYDSVFLTVGSKGTPSTFGIDVVSDSRDPLPVGPDGLPRPFSDDPRPDVSIAAVACVEGVFLYSHTTGTRRPARLWQVEAWDRDTFSGDDLLAVGLTDDAGRYRLCFDNSDESFTRQDVSMVFRAQNPWWGMQANEGQNRYAYRTRQLDNIPNGTTTMPEPPVPAAEMFGLQAFDEMADSWKFVGPGEHCWNGRPGRACKQIQVLWNPTASWLGNRCGQASDCYRTEIDSIFLSGNSPRFRNVVAHEAGHAVMDDSYRDAFPATTNCNPHFLTQTSSVTCAWVEGFADWFGVAVYGNPTFVGGPGGGVNLESATWGTPNWNSGEDVEGRVAGLLWDLVDGANEGAWDRHTESVENIWRTFRSHVSTTFSQFWNDHRRADGLPVDTPAVLATTYQNTIFTGVFYDPLGDQAEQSRPADGILEGYSFNTHRLFWSVAAVRPPGNTVFSNLFLWDDPGANIIKVSQAGSEINFVAIDSNRRAFGDYFLWMHHGANTPSGAQYQIELGQAGPTLGAGGVETIPFGAGDVVAVRDTFLLAGQTVRFIAFPGFGLDVDMFLMGSDINDATTWVRPRGEAAASSTRGGPGGFEDIFSFTAPSDGWYGLVLVSKSGAGDVTVQRFG